MRSLIRSLICCSDERLCCTDEIHFMFKRNEAMTNMIKLAIRSPVYKMQYLYGKIRLKIKSRFYKAAVIMLVIASLLVEGHSQSLAGGFNPNASNSVYALATQTDGKIIAGGSFAQMGGQPRGGLARLNEDGSLDSSFPNLSIGGMISPAVLAIAIQPDGKIIIAGQFTTVAGQRKNRIARLNIDGSLDIGFNTDTNGTIYALAIQPDGKILLGGAFTEVNGQARSYIARLNEDGSLDKSFTSNTDGTVYTITVHSDSTIFIGGAFNRVAEQKRSRLARLKPDGSLDMDFNPNADGDVLSIAVQSTGKILVGGNFSFIAGQNKSYLAQLKANGTIDHTFVASPNAMVKTLLTQPDGKLLIAGFFTLVNGQPRRYITRLNPDGTLDSSFPDVNVDGGSFTRILTLALQADGKIILGGRFTQISGQPRNNIARLSQDGKLN